MAEIRLGRAEVERGRLPEICMVCGGHSAVERVKTFSWFPSWTIYVGILLSMLFTKRMKMAAPLCHRHRNHWRMRGLLIWVGLVVVVFLTATALVVVAVKSAERGPGERPILISLAFGGVLLLGWLIMTIALQQSAIRATEITDESMTLTGVSPGFISALKDMRDERRIASRETARASSRSGDLDEEEEDDE